MARGKWRKVTQAMSIDEPLSGHGSPVTSVPQAEDQRGLSHGHTSSPWTILACPSRRRRRRFLAAGPSTGKVTSAWLAPSGPVAGCGSPTTPRDSARAWWAATSKTAATLPRAGHIGRTEADGGQHAGSVGRDAVRVDLEASRRGQPALKILIPGLVASLITTRRRRASWSAMLGSSAALTPPGT